MSATDTHAATAANDDLREVLRDYMAVTSRLQQTHETLQCEVMRLRTEVERKDRELERKRRLAALGELAAGVAHEVRNPLGAIQLYCGLLRRQFGTDPGIADLADKIDLGIRAIDGIVQDTLSLVPRGSDMERHSFDAIVSGACEQCRVVLEQRGVRVELLLNADGGELLADVGGLERVFINLITNAAQASPEAGVVRIETEIDAEGMLVARVTDDGPGISEELQDKIFDPFFTTKEHGTGLGLAISHRLVEAHGGRLSVRNRTRHGAEFEVSLPLADNEPPSAAGRDETNQTLETAATMIEEK